ncbi:TraX family protein [Vibrio splendidus]|nr:TraX family protein [Vibrio splendidus]MCC4883090.1 conjugal transfer protein TraX [Vibrio splendidus]
MKNVQAERDHALDIIKFMAIATMIIDHSRFLFPSLSMLFVTIGRASFPFFAICIAYNTHRLIDSFKVDSLNRYLRHLAIFAVISEIPHMLLFWVGDAPRTHNSILTLLIGAVFIMLYEIETHQTKVKYLTITLFSIVLAALEHKLEYGLPGVLLVTTLYAMAKSDSLPYKVLLLVVSMLVAIGMNLRYLGVTIEYYGWLNMYTIPFIAMIVSSLLFAFTLLHVVNINKSYCTVGKWMYWIYPTHMLIFAVVAMMMKH